MPVPKHEQISDFILPTQLPQSERQATDWQRANQRWWEENPMRYDWVEAHSSPELTKEFFEEVDRRFFETAREFLPWKKTPFDALIEFAEIQSKRVLEIGVGMGSHAQLLASHAKEFVGIDLTERAVAATRARLQNLALPGEILRMDAESMSFPDGSFDWVWSWGVIHHSSDTRRALAEIKRVLAPGGKAVLMVYHRSWWKQFVMGAVFHGLFRGRFFKAGSTHAVVQESTDGALARFYTVAEWKKLLAEVGLACSQVKICGQKAELLPLPAGDLKSVLLRAIPDAVGRIFSNQLKFGSYLVSIVRN